MTISKLPLREAIEVFPGKDEFVWIRQEIKGEEEVLMRVHVNDIDQFIEFLHMAKREAMNTMQGQDE